jgi:hypothetical protein
MTITRFDAANICYRSSKAMPCTEADKVYAYAHDVDGGPRDGDRLSIVAWQPSLVDIMRIMNGEPIFVAILGEGVLGEIPPHQLSTETPARGENLKCNLVVFADRLPFDEPC